MKIRVVFFLVLLHTFAGKGFAENLMRMVPEETFFVYNVNVSRICAIDPGFSKKVPNFLKLAEYLGNRNESGSPNGKGIKVRTPAQCLAAMSDTSALGLRLLVTSLDILARVFHINGFLPDDSQLGDNDEFAREAGFDPLKCLRQITVFVWGNAPKSHQERAILFEGSINPSAILKAVKEDREAPKSLSTDRFKGIDVIRSKEEENALGALFDASTAAFGTTAALMKVLAVRSGEANTIASNPVFTDLLKMADEKACFWGAGIISPYHKAMLKDSSSTPFGSNSVPFGALDRLFFSFDYDEELNIRVWGEIDDEKGMEPLMTALKGFHAMVRMIPAKVPEQIQLVDMVKIVGSGKVITITMDVKKSFIDDLRAKLMAKSQSPQEKR